MTDGGAQLRGAIEDLIVQRQDRRRAQRKAEGGRSSSGSGDEDGKGEQPARGVAPTGKSGLPVLRRSAWQRPQLVEQPQDK